MADLYFDANALFTNARDAVIASMSNPQSGYSLTDVLGSEEDGAAVFFNVISAQTFIQGTFCGAVESLRQRGIPATQVGQTELEERPGMHVTVDEFKDARANLAAALSAGGSERAANDVISRWLVGRLPFADSRAGTAVALAIVTITGLAIDDATRPAAT